MQIKNQINSLNNLFMHKKISSTITINKNDNIHENKKTNIDKYRVAANIRDYHIYISKLIFLRIIEYVLDYIYLQIYIILLYDFKNFVSKSKL